MKLPLEVLRAMSVLDHIITTDFEANDRCVEDAANDLLTELRRLHNEKPADPETTHALRRVRA